MTTKTSPFKKIPSPPDWVQIQQEHQVSVINLNQVEEVIFYPNTRPEASAIVLSYTSGTTREIRGEQALVLWNLIQDNLKVVKLSST